MSKREIITCDACRKEVENVVNLTIPIIVSSDDEKKYLKPHELDICGQCANRFAELYYSIAREHNSSGVWIITESGEGE